MDDLLKNLRALAKGKQDDFSVAYDAIKEITRLRLLVRHKKGPEPKLRAFLALTLGEKVPVTRNQFTGTGIDVNYFRTSAIWPLRLFHRVTANRGLIFPSRFA